MAEGARRGGARAAGLSGLRPDPGDLKTVPSDKETAGGFGVGAYRPTAGQGEGRRQWRLSAAAARRSVDRLALDLHVGPVGGAGRGPGAHPLLDLSRHGHEGLLHVGGALSARLQERDAQVVCELLQGSEVRMLHGLLQRSRGQGSYLGCSVVHHLLGGQVALVADQQLVDVLAGVAVDLLQPLLHVVERFLRTSRTQRH